MNWLFLLLALVFVVASGIVFFNANSQDKQRLRKSDATVTPTSSLVFIILAVITLFLTASIRQVAVSQQMVIFNSTTGQLRGPYGSGMFLTIPAIESSEIYDVFNKNVEQTGSSQSGIDARTKDGQQMVVDITLIYSLDPTQILPIHQKWSGKVENNLIIPALRSVARDEAAKFIAQEINAGQRVQYSDAMTATLKERLDPEGVIVQDVLLRSIDFSEEYDNAIEQVQLAELAKNQSKEQAETNRILSQGEADAVKIKAQGDADATILRAEADAKALELVAQQIKENPSLLMYRYIQELGNNVVAIVPSGSPFIFDANQLMNGFNSTPVPTATPAS